MVRSGSPVLSLIRHEVDRALERLGFASAEDVRALTQRVQSLEAAVRDLRDDVAAREEVPTA